MATWADIRFFQPREFDSKDAPGSGATKMNMPFVEKLDGIRGDVGFPLKVNSGYRTPAHNKKVGGAPSSAHVTGHAADLATGSWEKTFAVVKAALNRGIRRIGIAANGRYVHLDLSPLNPQPRIWFYP